MHTNDDTIKHKKNAIKQLNNTLEAFINSPRIYKPKNSSDLLYGIKFSDGAMDKINDKLQELFVHSK